MSIEVVILDSQDVPNPESRAVLQALASRSTKRIADQIDTVNADKTEKFIDMNCINYGHDSVIENAETVISLRGISMLAAKAIEDTPLFKGTEASTRYINVTGMPFISATKTDGEKAILELQKNFFDDNYPSEVEYNKTVYPIEKGQSEETYDKAIRAKTFDIMRSLLPAGASTIVNWTTDLRHAKDRLRALDTHPLLEVRALSSMITNRLISKYVSFKDFYNEKYDPIEEHMTAFANEYHYYDETPVYQEMDYWDNPNYLEREMDVGYTEACLAGFTDEYPSLKTRPKGCPPPRMYANRFAVSGLIDFGSFRDIQRHRNAICKIPVLGTKIGFETWYLNQMSSALMHKTLEHLDYLEKRIVNFSRIDAQYLVPFGYRVPFTMDMDLAQMIYVAELRSSKHVHPTARAVALHIGDFMETFMPDVKLHLDRSPDAFSIKRGLHTITGINV